MVSKTITAIFIFGIAGVFVAVLVRGLREGVLHFKGIEAHRDEQPGMFKGFAFLISLVVMCLVVSAIVFLTS